MRIRGLYVFELEFIEIASMLFHIITNMNVL